MTRKKKPQPIDLSEACSRSILKVCVRAHQIRSSNRLVRTNNYNVPYKDERTCAAEACEELDVHESFIPIIASFIITNVKEMDDIRRDITNKERAEESIRFHKMMGDKLEKEYRN